MFLWSLRSSKLSAELPVVHAFSGLRKMWINGYTGGLRGMAQKKENKSTRKELSVSANPLISNVIMSLIATTGIKHEHTEAMQIGQSS